MIKCKIGRNSPLIFVVKWSHIAGVPRGDESVGAEPYLLRMVSSMLVEDV